MHGFFDSPAAVFLAILFVGLLLSFGAHLHLTMKAERKMREEMRREHEKMKRREKTRFQLQRSRADAFFSGRRDV